jgi:sigma-B regulation protein RsbU (phosphoserine phosphatase)
MALFRSLIRAFADQHYSLGWIDLLGDSSLDAGGKQVAPSERSRSRQGLHRSKAIDLTNNYIAIHHGKSNMFATLFFGVLDPVTGVLNYINAGHEPPLLIGSNEIRASLEPTGPAVGLFAGVEFSIAQVVMEPGDTLLVYTDGVLDTQDADGVTYGEERLRDLVKYPEASAEAFLDSIHTSLTVFMAGSDQFDDITLLAIRRRAT